MKVRKAIIAVVLVVALLLIASWIWRGPVRLWFYYRSHFAGSQVVGWISGTPKEEEKWYAEIDYHGPKVKVYGTLVLTDSNYPGGRVLDSKSKRRNYHRLRPYGSRNAA